MRKKLIIVYLRVSSGSQNLREQEDACNKALSVRNINKEDVLYLKDFNVSATKNDSNNRPNYKKMLDLVSEGKVSVIFIYARDRAYRDFYEGSEFNKLMVKHNVEVIYTGTDEIPFNKNSSIESFYGIFGQQEGKNIRKRATDGTKRYPGKVIGYERIEKITEEGNREVTFVEDYDRSGIIKLLFEEFSQIQTKEEFVSVLTEFGKKLSGHSTVMKILQRPFYAAYCHTDFGFDRLNHVHPIITLELFKRVQSVLNSFIENYESAVLLAKEKVIITPICGVCNDPMKFKRPLGQSPYFVCSASHKKNFIDLDELNEAITEIVITETRKFTLAEYKPIFTLHLKGILDTLNHEKQYKEHLLNKTILAAASGDLVGSSNLVKHKKKILELQNVIEVIDQEILQLSSLKSEIESISKIVSPTIDKISKTNMDILVDLIVKQISVYPDYLDINLFSLVCENKKGAV
jgi:site-specific DNA recombinase